ncbi:heat shock protein 90-like [Rosa rugosa]|uniref:heat shock protein 90-like n=1 Tax=Rosa rugosa TaxID=74645 RepID=UPI002B4139F0|nr:heat shock protein 90-like [Rosa rugosa]
MSLIFNGVNGQGIKMLTEENLRKSVARNSEDNCLGVHPQQILYLYLREWEKNDYSGFIKALITNSNSALEILNHLKVDLPPSELLPHPLGLDGPDFSYLGNQYICVIFDEEHRTLCFIDSGIGMNKQDLMKFICVMGSSGNRLFTEQTGVKVPGENGMDFYRTFVVSNKVYVTSKHPLDQQFLMKFSATDNKGIGCNPYTIGQDEVGPPLGRGIKIVVHLNDKYCDWYRWYEVLKMYFNSGAKAATYPVYEWANLKKLLFISNVYKKKAKAVKADSTEEKEEEETEFSTEEKNEEENKGIPKEKEHES